MCASLCPRGLPRSGLRLCDLLQEPRIQAPRNPGRKLEGHALPFSAGNGWLCTVPDKAKPRDRVEFWIVDHSGKRWPRVSRAPTQRLSCRLWDRRSSSSVPQRRGPTRRPGRWPSLEAARRAGLCPSRDGGQSDVFHLSHPDLHKFQSLLVGRAWPDDGTVGNLRGSAGRQ